MIEVFTLCLLASPFVLGFLLFRCRKTGKAISVQLVAARESLAHTIRELDATSSALQAANSKAAAMTADHDRIKPYLHVADIDAEARRLIDNAKAEAIDVSANATREAESLLAAARREAVRVVEDAKAQASEAMALVGHERELKAMIEALENRLKGYDDSYLQPAALLLEDLADGYGSQEAAEALKAARAATRTLLKAGRAATCEYAEATRRQTAMRFVTDAFNGAADSILSRIKVDNAGKLAQEMKDSAATITMHGRAFRNAAITSEYLSSRLEELRAAAQFQALLKHEQEEQRAIKERMREEARAQREFEIAQRTAAKEEERARKAFEEARKQIESATADERAALLARFAELEKALAEAEAKTTRAQSMAQQTRAGHCYVISNEGSFGADVLKIGMTRRLEPLDRVRELGDASVPFEFDVHALIYSEDAPSLERLLHREFNAQRVNMVNPRKEFFRVDLAAVKAKLKETGLEAEFTMTAAAREFRETQALLAGSFEQRKVVLDAVLAAEAHIDEDAEAATQHQGLGQASAYPGTEANQ